MLLAAWLDQLHLGPAAHVMSIYACAVRSAAQMPAVYSARHLADRGCMSNASAPCKYKTYVLQAPYTAYTTLPAHALRCHMLHCAHVHACMRAPACARNRPTREVPLSARGQA